MTRTSHVISTYCNTGQFDRLCYQEERGDWGMTEGGQGLVRLGGAEVRTSGADAVVRRQRSSIMGCICAV